MDFHGATAMQHKIRFRVARSALNMKATNARRTAMGFTQSVNALVICAAFIFVGAMLFI
tara:strand:+ start:152 stop:328 length:177 start_codon:yes stop_codon:yes gene_type:complete